MSAAATVAATGRTRPNAQGSSTPVQVEVLHKVTYVFHVVSGDNLSIPYAVAIDGTPDPAFASKPKRVSGSRGKVTLRAKTGSKVSLYLNSDSRPNYRKNPVYAVTVGDHDLVINITERMGLHDDADTPTLQPPTTAPGTEPVVDTYAAPLNGTIWMKVSHKYEEGEVVGLIPADTSAEVLAAVKSIYAELSEAQIAIDVPASPDKPAHTLSVKFVDSDNPRANIVHYSMLADGLTRVHPAGYAALFDAAIASGITNLRLTSCWRPMLGSIAHRAGLGLDVDYIGPTRMNRQALRSRAAVTSASNVSDAERQKFNDYEAALNAQRQAKADAASAQHVLSSASGQDARAAASQRLAAANASLTTANQNVTSTRTAWNAERDANEPVTVHEFRASLLHCSCVAQLFDPWFMDLNTRSGATPDPNAQKSGLEKLHATHLHITVSDPKIL